MERQTELGDRYRAVEEETKFTPTCPFLDQNTRIAYTLPFQELVLPFHDSAGHPFAKVKLLTLFIPYALRKFYGDRPPLMHMAAIIGDIPLLKRAVDVENRGELWDFNVPVLGFCDVGIESAFSRINLSPEAYLRVSGAAARATQFCAIRNQSGEVGSNSGMTKIGVFSTMWRCVAIIGFCVC